ncbi:MAG: NADH-quinone oxidoreductase subunit C [candidate division Zixibacteria bacterium]|nr:NADH-quinone oxidoreductase subunit C [candidate division Zixibacteria bacterium]
MDITTRDKVVARFGEKLLETSTAFDELTFLIDKGDLLAVVRFLRDDPALKYLHLSDITATDWLDRPKRFEVVYHLYSFDLRDYVRVKVRVGEEEPIDSLCSEWDGANWLEREVYDLFGVKFTGHPDLRRILTWEGFEGHPLRKDYPLTYEVPQFTYNKDEPPEVIK